LSEAMELWRGAGERITWEQWNLGGSRG
jgi:hypothetical protein